MCDTPSDGIDHLWLIWKESIQNCRCYRADTAAGTDGRTDGQTDGVKPIYPPTTSLCIITLVLFFTIQNWYERQFRAIYCVRISLCACVMYLSGCKAHCIDVIYIDDIMTKMLSLQWNNDNQQSMYIIVIWHLLEIISCQGFFYHALAWICVFISH